jgi:hypothetical protein
MDNLIESSSSSTNDSNFNELKVFKRLMELKELYEIQRKELGILFNGKQIKNYKITPDSSGEEEIPSKEEEIEEELDQNGNSSLKVTKTNQNKDPPFSDHQLQDVIRGIIERHGGSSHLETIVENVKVRWQRGAVCKPDGTPFGHADCKKAVQANFRIRSNNQCIFSRDKDNDGCWTILTEDMEEKNYKVLSVAISEAIEEHGGLCHLDDIYSYLEENWNIPPLSDGAEYAKPEKEFQVRITLSTNPKFMEDSENPDFYFVTKKKRRGNSNRRDPEYEKKTKNNNISRVTRRSRNDDESEEYEGFRENGRRSTRITSPPSDYVCKCGAKEPGKGPSSRWRKAPNGEFLCNNCSLQLSKKHACPVCGKVYKKNESHYNDENAWIRCDDCHRWVMTKCDNISDLSLYDDGNPNHLHYSCPICREDTSLFGSIKFNGKKEDIIKVKNTSKKLVKVSEQEDNIEKEGEGKLEATERTLLDKIASDYSFDSEKFNEDEEVMERLSNQEASFADDINQFTAQLLGKRDRGLNKNQIEYEKKKRRLKQEKMKMDERIELELVQELKNYFNTRLKEAQKQKQNLVHYYHSKIERNLL